jgi:hypothetical protein
MILNSIAAAIVVVVVVVVVVVMVVAVVVVSNTYNFMVYIRLISLPCSTPFC